MEKNNDRQINYDLYLKMFVRFQTFLLMFILGIFFSSNSLSAQIRAGSGYLKMLHGAREVSTFGTITGALDHTYSFYANPAATGFLREWQWSATYTNWISDIYNASVLYGRTIRTPWSRWSRFVAGVNYLGIPEFNNANGNALAVSGQNLLVTVGFGQPLHFLSRKVALGANIKYFNSQLAGYDANKFLFDLGLLYRTPQIRLANSEKNLFNTLIFSSGISLTNIGTSMQFISENTPVPRTFRAGVALNIGSHYGFQVSVGTDYRKIRDEDGFLTCGTEFSWRQILSLRMGYSWEENVLGHFTFGGSLRLDDLLFQNSLLGRSNALQIDLASNQNNDYFTAPYHGSVTHKPLEPENFNLLEPEYNESIDQDNVTLSWEETQDPDLYDNVFSYLLVDKDSSKLNRILAKVHQKKDPLPLVLADNQLLINRSVDVQKQLLTELTGGDYYWTVVTFDKDEHTQMGKISNKPLAKFHVTAPIPQVTDIQFNYSPWITRDDYQGELAITVKNLGDRPANNFKLELFDSSQTKQNPAVPLSETMITELVPNADTTIYIEWHTADAGRHGIRSHIQSTDSRRKFKHTYIESFYTIPKGYIQTADTSIVQRQRHIIYDLPYVGKVYFDSSNAIIPQMFIDNWDLKTPLSLFAERLKHNPSIKIKIKGYIDPNSGETDLTLANQRSNAVRDQLHNFGVNLDQIYISRSEMLPKRRLPKKEEDRRWVLEERRRVDITTITEHEATLFDPLQTTYVQKINQSVPFDARIKSTVPILDSSLRLSSESDSDSIQIEQNTDNKTISGKIEWNFERVTTSEQKSWIQNSSNYSVRLVDSEKRIFRTKPQNMLLTTQIESRERRYYVLAKFEKTAPFYNFYWSSLLDIVPFLLEDENTRMQFVGHGCATGPIAINEQLSKRRANDFQDKFLYDVKRRYPELYKEIKQRIDAPKGFGESQPFIIKSDNETEILLGNNEIPLGRQLNRRVMILIYTNQ